MEGSVLFTSLEYIVILSIIVIVSPSVESINVICPHNGMYDLCVKLRFCHKQVFWT